MKRWAIVGDPNPDTVKSIKELLPKNYQIVYVCPDGVLICGEDDHGWTMDDYVIPRLGSGLIAAHEVSPAFISESPRGVTEWEMEVPKEWLERGIPLGVLS